MRAAASRPLYRRVIGTFYHGSGGARRPPGARRRDRRAAGGRALTGGPVPSVIGRYRVGPDTAAQYCDRRGGGGGRRVPPVAVAAAAAAAANLYGD